MEVGLTITVGTVLVAAGVVAYMHAREAAGDAAAKQKVADLQLMVEDYYTRYNSYPTLGTDTNPGVRQMWTAARTDGLKSPWGGQVINPQNRPIEGCDNQGESCPPNAARKIGGPDNSCPTDSSGERCGSRRDNLIYHRYQIPGAPADVWNVWDAGNKAYVPVSGYSVSINKQGRSFFFISSGRTAQ